MTILGFLGVLFGGISITSFVAWSLNAIQGSKKAPCFSYDYESSHCIKGEEGEFQVCYVTFRGVICNRSLTPNSLMRVHIACEDPRWLVPFFSSFFVSIRESRDKGPILLPRLFTGRECLPVIMSHKLEWPHSELRNSWTIVFEDLDGNFFDMHGRHFDMRSNNLRIHHRVNPKSYPIYVLALCRVRVAFLSRTVLAKLGFAWR